ncbi:MAG: hypothetical protein NY202_02115 [Mollicutes bacterium UO1]
MVKAQEFLNKKYPHRTRDQLVTDYSINISSQNLEGNLELNLDKFPNLEYLDVSDNLMTGIIFASSVKEVNKKQKLEPKIKFLNLSNNKFDQQDLTCVSELTNLEELFVSNTNFRGNLEPLKNLTKLRKLDISNTNIDSG